ncbi:PAS domain-containing protein [Pseudomonas plecoglossicida]|uniref:PAS domain-containing protein n=1 Tax=Pseudomonas plecoglossicida TaxID=70775 RepID=UPI0015E364ED|nr:PAS domain-containing protein [Pseudomonas plecoglossicida]MBA1196249.1 PAS domain-containing protein [Pseudomonas plecoglossicida]
MEHRPTLRTESAGPPLSATGSSSTVHDSELRFRALVRASSTTIYRMSPDWTQMHELTGQGFLEETAQPCQSWIEKYIPDADRTQVLAAVEQAIRTQSVFELEHRVLLVDGSFGWTHSRAVPIFDQSGELPQRGRVAAAQSRRGRQATPFHRPDPGNC